jgi:hypothetical protein
MIETGNTGQYRLTDAKVASDLAKLLAFHARRASSKEETLKFWRMAQECQAEAAKFDSGMMPDIGDPPACLSD